MSNVQISIASLDDSTSRYDLVLRFMELRKTTFIDKMSWDLYHHNGVEFEQYDSLRAVYVIAHDGDKVLGGARLLRTDMTLGRGKVSYTYMIRDAYNGNLPGMPTEICFDEPPKEESVWELTRLATKPSVDVASQILNGANAYLASQGASRCLFLGPPAFMRMARSMGYEPKPMGPIVGNSDGRFLAFSCSVVTPCQSVSI